MTEQEKDTCLAILKASIPSKDIEVIWKCGGCRISINSIDIRGDCDTPEEVGLLLAGEDYP